MSNRGHPFRWTLPALVAVLALVGAACGDDSGGGSTAASSTTTSSTAAFEGELVGLFAVTPADCSAAGAPTGSYFRMIQSGGDLAAGPYVPNADSSCTDQTYLPLAPGTDGGLTTGAFQPAPDPAFDEAGNGLAARIVQPATFFGVDFAVATSEQDPQTEATVTAPAITASAGELSGDLSAVGAYYGAETFNQGAPKPDGSLPGLTTAPTGTIDPETGAYVLEWTSGIVGGPFNGFTGLWHLEGTFTAG